MWHHIHMMPEEVVLATQDLQAAYLIPVHSAKFPLANHAWDEPLIRVTKAAQEEGVNLITPQIGEVVYMDSIPTYRPRSEERRVGKECSTRWVRAHVQVS